MDKLSFDEKAVQLCDAADREAFMRRDPPRGMAACEAAEIDEEIGNYHLTNIQQGFTPSMMLNFNNGTPTKEEQDAIERKITNKFTSTNGK